MNLVRPFVAHLPTPELAAQVVTPPLGGLTTRQWLQLSEDNPHSFLHVMRTEVDTEEGGSDPYLHGVSGTARLSQMIESGVLRPTPRPAYYVYLIDDGLRSATGIVAEVHVSGYGDGRIRRHENTRAATEELLLSHLLRVGAHSDPVALTHRVDDDLASIVTAIRSSRTPDLRFTGIDGARQEVWVVADEPTVALIQTGLDSVGPLYVTDGHHRCAASVRYAAGRSADVGHTGEEDYNYVLAALYGETELTLREFNRCVRSDEFTQDEVVDAVAALVPLDEVSPDAGLRSQMPGEAVLVTGARAYRFQLPASSGSSSVAALDVSRLQDFVLGPVFGIADPRTDHRLHYIAADQPTDPSHHHCVACFLLHPTSVAEVMRIADAGEVMPPKSTWFEPKVRGGLFIALL